MSLRDDCVEEWFESFNEGYDKRMQKVINKVLDAVCAEINNVGLGAHNTAATINAVNKLRGE